ncbi:MAG TPA: S8 family serine peptidase [Gaiellaceae bacterium]|nr:S8 family serine peptidase [Gaiellaceae bacterium]
MALLTAGAALTLVLAAATAPAKSPGGQLSKEENALLREAQAQGKDSVILLIATQPGQAKTVVDGLQGLGASIGYRDDQLGYVRASVAIDKVEQAFALAGVAAADLDRTIPVGDPRPEGVSPVLPQPPPGAATPRQNPYMPTQDTGAAQFVNAHPTWDGRGVTIGIVDTGVSFDHPSLTTTSTGERKIVDWVTGTDPLRDPDPTWINMKDQVSGASFTWNGATYTAPAAGSYRIGAFRENNPRFGGEFSTGGNPDPPGGDLNRDGDETDVFALLWNPTTDDVWVDTNGNRSFADQTSMRNYSVRNDVGWFGTDDPATPVAERVPFVVQTDGKNRFVNLGIVAGAHASHVAGIAAGNKLFGGEMSGAAPGAKIVSSRACLFVAGCTSHALFEGMIFVAKQRNVDVINMSIGGLPALNDGNNARCALYDRLIEQSNVQMFISQGNNGPGVNTAGDPGLCGNVLGIGASITSATYERDYGTPMPFADNLHFFSSRGPREDGGFAPELVAPGAAISSTPMWQPGGPVSGTYALPPGYSLFNGTSMAAPQATGVGALLVSAAKAAGVQHQPAQIRQALLSTARYLDPTRFQASDQGLGLIDIGAAWDLLKASIKTVDITGTVPVNSLLSGFLASPGVGTGIYDREGVTAGSTYTRTYTFTRNDGPGGSIAYKVGWVGNDGTFSSAGSISLARGGSSELTVTITPSAGAHSAILTLDDPSTTGIDYGTMNTVIAPYELVSPSYSQTISSDIARGQSKHYFFRVPANTPAFKVDMTGGGDAAGAGAIRFLRWHPWGLAIESNAVSNCYNGAPGGCNGTASPTSRTVTSPQAGVWEVTIDARRNSDAYPAAAPFTLKATILGAKVEPNPDTIASATIGSPISRSYTLTNLFGEFVGKAQGTDMGSALIQTPTIAHHAQQQYPVTIPAGTKSLRATIGSPSDPAADLDLFVFNCTSGTCVLAGQSADGDSEESVTVTNPAAGAWVVLVDGFDVPAGSTTYKYIDVYFKTAPLGTIRITDANALRPSGSSWTVSGTVTANAAPGSGRVLYGNVEVRTDTNVLVGSGDVIVQNVSP